MVNIESEKAHEHQDEDTVNWEDDMFLADGAILEIPGTCTVCGKRVFVRYYRSEFGILETEVP